MSKQDNHQRLTYNPPNSEIELKVLFAEDSAWLTKEQILDLLKPNIDPLEFVTINETDIKRIEVSKYIEKKYKLNYCFKLENTKFFEHDDFRLFVTTKGRQRYYNVDAVLAIAYKFDFRVAKHFRKWVDNQPYQSKAVKTNYNASINNVYLLQVVVKFIFALIMALYVGDLLSRVEDIGGRAGLIVAFATIFMALYDSIFEAIRYSFSSGFIRDRNKK